MGKGRCAECHIPQQSFMDNNMHDLKLERFYKIGQVVNDLVAIRMARSRPSPARHQGLAALSA